MYEPKLTSLTCAKGAQPRHLRSNDRPYSIIHLNSHGAKKPRTEPSSFVQKMLFPFP